MTYIDEPARFDRKSAHGGGSDDNRLRLAIMAGALAVAAVFGAAYAQVQALI